MSRAAAVPKLIDVSGLDEYPEDLCDPRLSSDYFTMFWHDRWLNSTLHLTASMDVQGAALNLFFAARKQTPVGSLPDNDRILSRLLHLDLEVWLDLRARPVGPLHNWRPMRFGDGIVLGHDVVIEVALDALGRRQQRQASNGEKAVAMRRKRLAEQMQRMGCSAPVVGDRDLVARLDDWLEEHHPGQRRMPQFEASINRALRHAHSAGWLPGGR
jgi:hypothetical protein